MGLLNGEEYVEITLSSSNVEHYENLGYYIPRRKKNGKMSFARGSKIMVKIKDLIKGSRIKTKCKCDNCGKIIYPTFMSYFDTVKENGETYCNKCAMKLYGRDNCIKTMIKKGESFEQWCIENNKQDILDRWDYELNDCKPNEVCYGTKNKYWYKCNKNPKHKSELKCIGSLTTGTSSIKCNQCNSVAQYILNNFPDKDLYDVWDRAKNGDLDPWEISGGSHVKIWIKCQKKDYHGNYEMSCSCFTIENQRCPYCTHRNNKIHKLDSLGQYIIDNYGEEFLWKVWSDKNDKSPFEYSVGSEQKVWWRCVDKKHKDYKQRCKGTIKCEFRCPKCVEERKESMLQERTRLYLQELGYEIKTEYNCSLILKNPKKEGKKQGYFRFDNEIILENGKHLFIEVHGEQHYKLCYYYKTKEELHNRQLIDRYKRIKCIQAGYEYLELPYTAFDKKETYKKLINDKIKNILDK